MTSSPALQTASKVEIIASVDPQHTVSSFSGSTEIPCHTPIWRAIALRRFFDPQVIAYWITSPAITWGSKNLRNAIARQMGVWQGISVDPEKEITVCCGSTEAMISTLLGVCNAGDEVVIFEPFYENYGPDSVLSGARPRFVKLRPPAS